ncbi:MAG TPA: CvpA family protein [Acidobacteriaceae bacterium]
MMITNWNAFDWVLVVIVVVSMVAAFRRGLVRAIFGLLGLIGGFQIAAWTYSTVGDWISASSIKVSPATARIIGFLLVVIAVSVGLEIVGWLFQKALRHVGLGPFDRLLGVAFGFARGCMVGIALLMATTTFAPQSGIITTSAISPYLFAVAHDVSFLVPQYLQQLMASGAYDFNHNPPRWINGD